MRGTPAFYHGFYKSRTDAVCYDYQQAEGKKDKEEFAQGVVLEDDDEQREDNKRPGKGVGHGVHDVVPEDGVAAVECQRPFVIKLYEV